MGFHAKLITDRELERPLVCMGADVEKLKSWGAAVLAKAKPGDLIEIYEEVDVLVGTMKISDGAAEFNSHSPHPDPARP